jgi:hypothetical protein
MESLVAGKFIVAALEGDEAGVFRSRRIEDKQLASLDLWK